MAVAAAALLAGCAGGMDLKQAEIDETLLTSSVSADSNKVVDAARISDEVTIRNAISSADLKSLAAGGISWANADTGSRGAITNLLEYRRKGLLCRKFSVSRESYDGVALFSGDACRASDGGWRMLAFTES